MARTGAPGACFAAVPDISYWPSMTAMLARTLAPSGVSVSTVDIGVPIALRSCTSGPGCSPTTVMSVTFTVGWPSDRIVADGASAVGFHRHREGGVVCHHLDGHEPVADEWRDLRGRRRGWLPRALSRSPARSLAEGPAPVPPCVPAARSRISRRRRELTTSESHETCGFPLAGLTAGIVPTTSTWINHSTAPLRRIDRTCCLDQLEG